MVLRNTLLMALLVSLTACANNTALYNPPAYTMSHEDMNYWGYDCAHAAEQKAFLEHKLRNISPLDQNNRDRGIIQAMLVQMRDDCGDSPKQKPMGCVHVREDFKNGSANSTVCYADPRGQRPTQLPTINHFDPLVDMK